MATKVDPIDISELVEKLTEIAGIEDKRYVQRIDLEPHQMTVHVLRGIDGHCKGVKYVDLETNEVAMEDPRVINIKT